MTDQELIKYLFAALEERDAIIKTVIPELETRINELQAQLAVYQNKKDSSNSHKPPSTDIHTPQRNRSLRKKSNKKPGGQKGHEGSTLLFSDQVDEVIKYTPTQCGKCGRSLSSAEESLYERRPVVDIPIVIAKRSERAIRNIKVKQKVSGFFKSVQGAKNYVVIRSFIDTATKAGLPIFASLVKIAIVGTE